MTGENYNVLQPKPIGFYMLARERYGLRFSNADAVLSRPMRALNNRATDLGDSTRVSWRVR